MMAEVRSVVGERRWSGRRYFLEESGRAVQFGMMVVGSRSPAIPAFIRPPPLSRTITVFDDDIVVCGCGCGGGEGVCEMVVV